MQTASYQDTWYELTVRFIEKLETLWEIVSNASLGYAKRFWACYPWKNHQFLFQLFYYKLMKYFLGNPISNVSYIIQIWKDGKIEFGAESLSKFKIVGYYICKYHSVYRHIYVIKIEFFKNFSSCLGLFIKHTNKFGSFWTCPSHTCRKLSLMMTPLWILPSAPFSIPFYLGSSIQRENRMKLYFPHLIKGGVDKISGKMTAFKICLKSTFSAWKKFKK